MLRNADGGARGVKFSRKKRYERVKLNVISVMRGWVGLQFSGKKRLNGPYVHSYMHTW